MITQSLQDGSPEKSVQECVHEMDAHLMGLETSQSRLSSQEAGFSFKKDYRGVLSDYPGSMKNDWRGSLLQVDKLDDKENRGNGNKTFERSQVFISNNNGNKIAQLFEQDVDVTMKARLQILDSQEKKLEAQLTNLDEVLLKQRQTPNRKSYAFKGCPTPNQLMSKTDKVPFHSIHKKFGKFQSKAKGKENKAEIENYCPSQSRKCNAPSRSNSHVKNHNIDEYHMNHLLNHIKFDAGKTRSTLPSNTKESNKVKISTKPQSFKPLMAARSTSSYQQKYLQLKSMSHNRNSIPATIHKVSHQTPFKISATDISKIEHSSSEQSKKLQIQIFESKEFTVYNSDNDVSLKAGAHSSKQSFYESARVLRENKLIVCTKKGVQIYDIDQLNLDLKIGPSPL